jgi:hypothetical protein
MFSAAIHTNISFNVPTNRQGNKPPISVVSRETG